MPRAAADRIEQRKLTRQRLIDGALEMFSTTGYEHATVDDISRAAGYSKGAYYFHFSTKDDILLELLRLWTEERTALLLDDSAGELTADELRDMLTGFFSYEDRPRWPGVLLEFWSVAVRNPEVSKRLAQTYATWRGRIANAFRAAARSGLGVEAPEDTATVVLAAHDGFVVQTAIGAPGGKAMTARELAESIITPLETTVEERQRGSIAL
jgi:AcrR family transcriptional regulator